MKIKFYSLLLASITYTNAFAQLEIKAQTAAGGGSYDDLSCMVPTNDGGFIVGGTSPSNILEEKSENSKGGSDYWIVKYDARHNKEWDKTIGGSGSDILSAILQTSDGGYLLGGSSISNISGDKSENSRGVYDYWVVKLDSDGEKKWDKTLGENEDDRLTCLLEVGVYYLLGGYSFSDHVGTGNGNKGGSDYWVYKLHNSGTFSGGQKDFGGSGNDFLQSIQQTSDGGYILGGHSVSNSSGNKTEDNRGPFLNLDFWIIKLNSGLLKEWDKTIGGYDDEYLVSVMQTDNGRYIIGGSSYSNISGEKTENSRGRLDYWVVKVDNIGRYLWDRTFGGSGDDFLESIQEANNDGQGLGYILGGFSASNVSGEKTETSRGSDDYWIVYMRRGGTKKWDKTVGGTNVDLGRDVFEISKNRYIVGGTSSSRADGDKGRVSRGSADYWLVWLNYNGPDDGEDLTAEQNTSSVIPPNFNTIKTFILYPNPAKDVLHIQTTGKTFVSLTDASGKTVFIQIINGKGEMNISRLKAGIYFLKNHATGEVKKVVVEN